MTIFQSILFLASKESPMTHFLQAYVGQLALLWQMMSLAKRPFSRNCSVLECFGKRSNHAWIDHIFFLNCAWHLLQRPCNLVAHFVITNLQITMCTLHQKASFSQGQLQLFECTMWVPCIKNCMLTPRAILPNQILQTQHNAMQKNHMSLRQNSNIKSRDY